MGKFPNGDGHFRAEIEIFSGNKSPRKRHAFNGIRWAFVYADEFDALGVDGNTYRGLYSDIWPEFLDANGKQLDSSIPLKGVLPAIMHIVWPNMIDVHFKRLELGTRFYCMEGIKACAEGRITSLRI